jgi:uncharacterized integral membrane protein
MSFQFQPGDASGKPESGKSADSGRNRTPLLVAWAILAVAGVAFIAQNTTRVAFEFLLFDFRWPLWVMLVVFFALGALTGLIIAWRRGKP